MIIPRFIKLPVITDGKVKDKFFNPELIIMVEPLEESRTSIVSGSLSFEIGLPTKEVFDLIYKN